MNQTLEWDYSRALSVWLLYYFHFKLSFDSHLKKAVIFSLTSIVSMLAVLFPLSNCSKVWFPVAVQFPFQACMASNWSPILKVLAVMHDNHQHEWSLVRWFDLCQQIQRVVKKFRYVLILCAYQLRRLLSQLLYPTHSLMAEGALTFASFRFCMCLLWCKVIGMVDCCMDVRSQLPGKSR